MAVPVPLAVPVPVEVWDAQFVHPRPLPVLAYSSPGRFVPGADGGYTFVGPGAGAPQGRCLFDAAEVEVKASGSHVSPSARRIARCHDHTSGQHAHRYAGALRLIPDCARCAS